MKYLVINGSPKGKRSITMKVVAKFLEGVTMNSNNEVEIVDVAEKNILNCRGCFACWSVLQGGCIYDKKDEMKKIREMYDDADCVIFSTPVHFVDSSSYIQKVIERLLPFAMPKSVGENYFNPQEREQRPEYTFSMAIKKIVVFATSMVVSPWTFDVINNQFSLLTGNNMETIFLRQPVVAKKEDIHYIKDLNKILIKAGKEHGEDGSIRYETKKEIDEISAVINELEWKHLL